jgi:hypothetical protein
MDYGECLSVIQNQGEINMRFIRPTHIRLLSLVRLAIIQLPRHWLNSTQKYCLLILVYNCID